MSGYYVLLLVYALQENSSFINYAFSPETLAFHMSPSKTTRISLNIINLIAFAMERVYFQAS